MSEHLKEENLPESLRVNDVVSSTECAGMIHAMPETDGEAENYDDVYGIPDQKALKL